jgi:soluble lytic murein transglycosylase-like protein
MRRTRSAFCLALGLSLLLSGIPAFADIYRYRDENGVWHFTNIKNDKRYRLYLRDYQEKPAEFIKRYGSVIEQASERFRLDPSLLKAVIKAESGFDSKATSSKGAQGLMQLMPDTAEQMEVSNPYNPEENIFGGARYLSILFERFRDNIMLALAAYNAGPESVEEYNGVPPFPETKSFIKRVLNFYSQYRKENR